MANNLSTIEKNQTPSIVAADVESELIAQFDVACGMLGVPFDEVKDQLRVLFIPTSDAAFVRRRAQRRHGSALVARASEFKIRLVGERLLYLLKGREFTALARGTSLDDLCARAVQAMSSVSASLGSLDYVILHTQDSASLRSVKKHLDTNEFSYCCKGELTVTPQIAELIGAGGVAIVFVPESLPVSESLSLQNA